MAEKSASKRDLLLRVPALSARGRFRSSFFSRIGWKASGPVSLRFFRTNPKGLEDAGWTAGPDDHLFY